MIKQYKIRLDLCTICNLNCTACSMRKLNYGKIGAGYVKFEQFKSFIDNNKQYIKSLEISNFGEPFLNPDILNILDYAYINDIKLTCTNGTNFNFKNDILLKKLVNNGFYAITISLDGASQKVYEQYRRNGNFNLVIENIKKINQYKKELNSQYPILIWQYVLRESTENPEEIKKAIEMAQDLNMKIKFKLTWEREYKPKMEWVEQIKQLTKLDFLTRDELPTLHPISAYSKCLALYQEREITINWDGRWLGCCRNKIPSDLNIFELGIDGLITNQYYKDTLKYLADPTAPLNDLFFCTHCKYLNREDNEVRQKIASIIKIYGNEGI